MPLTPTTDPQPPGSATSSVSLDSLNLATGAKITDIRLRQTTVTFDDLCRRFSTPDLRRGRLSSAKYHALDKTKPADKRIRQDEKDGEYFFAARFKADGTRTNPDVEAIWGIVLDFDTGKTTQADIRHRLDGLTYIAYTSFSHRPTDERWRVIIVLKNEILSDQLSPVFAHFQDLFDNDLDKRGGVPSQGWYTPACPYDAAEDFVCFHEVGNLFDAAPFLNRSTAATKPAPESSAHQETIPVGGNANAAPQRLVIARNSSDRLLSALAHLDADERSSWIETGLALHNELGDKGRALWLQWSAQSKKFDQSEAMKTWDSFKSRAPGEPALTLGTIYHRAKQAGWSDIPVYIREMNERFFVAPLGTRYAIFQERRDPLTGALVPIPMLKDSYQLMMANRLIEEVRPDGNTRSIAVGNAWIKSPHRREYAGVVLDPELRDPDYYNLWRGFPIEPASGRWRLLRWHMLFVICSGVRRHYRYLLGWMAFCVQYPGRTPEVALVLQGGRGTGKSLFLRAFGQLFEPHFMQITQPSHLTGNFNAHLQNTLFVFADEAYYAGDKVGEATLKGLVTEPTIAIERKGFDVDRQPNRIKLAMASNSEWVVPAGIDERRFFVLHVSDIKKQDPGYFSALVREMESSAPAAMLYDLLKRDLSRFNVRKPPNTKALKDQKVLSLAPHQRWWLDRLATGVFPASQLDGAFDVPWGSVPTSIVHDDYIRTTQKSGLGHRSSSTQLGMQLRSLLPGYAIGPVKRKWNLGGETRVPHYDFPPLDVCRTVFVQMVGLDGYEWPAVAPEVVRSVMRGRSAATEAVASPH